MKKIDVVFKDIFESNSHKYSWKLKIVKNWKSIVGNLYEKISIEKIEEDSIIIGIENSSLMNQIFFFTAVIKDAINELLGINKIKKIKLRLKKEVINLKEKRIFLKNSIKNIEQNKSFFNIEINQEIVFSEKEIIALKQIKDPELAILLANFRKQCWR